MQTTVIICVGKYFWSHQTKKKTRFIIYDNTNNSLNDCTKTSLLLIHLVIVMLNTGNKVKNL